MSNQEIFDTVWHGLQGQGFEKSVGPNGIDCLYRGPRGRKCAIGHLIPDDEYAEDFENHSIDTMYDNGLLPTALCGLPTDLLDNLMEVHDFSDNDMELGLRGVAKRWGLDVPE